MPNVQCLHKTEDMWIQQLIFWIKKTSVDKKGQIVNGKTLMTNITVLMMIKNYFVQQH